MFDFYKKKEKLPPVNINGIFLRYFPTSTGKIAINTWIHVDKFVKELEKHVNENGYVAFVILEKSVADDHGNDYGCILNTYKPKYDGEKNE